MTWHIDSHKYWAAQDTSEDTVYSLSAAAVICSIGSFSLSLLLFSPFSPSPVLFFDYFSHQTFNFFLSSVSLFFFAITSKSSHLFPAPPHDSLPPSTLSVSLPPPLRLSLHHCLVYPNVCLLLFTVITLSLFRPLQHQHPSVTTGITYRQ